MILDVLFANPMTQWIISLFFLFLIMRLFAYFAQSGMIGKADNYVKHCERVINTAIVKTVTTASTHSNNSLDVIDSRIRELVTMFSISPVAKDPAGIMEKLRNNIDASTDLILDDIREIVSEGNEKDVYRIVLMTSVTNAMHVLTRYLRHFVKGAKKKDEIAKMNLIASFRLMKEMFEAYELAFIDFSNHRIIGDGIGPLTVAHIAKEQELEWATAVEYRTSYAIYKNSGRNIWLVKATGPHGNTGQVGRFIGNIKPDMIITIDAALKMHGEETGDVRTGVGAAIGGAGYERYTIEETGVKSDCPLYAVIVPMSMKEAITVMPEAVFNAMPEVLRRVYDLIERRTSEGDLVMVVGVGNTLGVDG